MLELRKIVTSLGIALLISFLVFSVGISLWFALSALAAYFGPGIFSLMFVWFVILTGGIATVLYWGLKL